MTRTPLIAAATIVLFLAGTAMAELCDKCAGKMYVDNVGKCVECGGATSSSAFKLCKACSEKLGECENCRAKLAKDETTTQPATQPTTCPTSQPTSLPATEPAGPVMILTAVHNGKTLTCHASPAVIKICLAGNPTTGYQWDLDKIEGDGVKQVSKTKYKQDEKPAQKVGIGGTFTTTFLTTGKGETTIRMKYFRPWEKDAKPEKTFSITVVVPETPASTPVKAFFTVK
jgi:predicted secreted protein